MLMPQNIDQGEPPATQFFLLENSASSEPSAEALFLSTESIVQGEPFATEAHFPLLEDSAPSEPFATEAHFPERKYKTWTPGPWTPSVHAVHGPGPSTPCFY